MNCQRGRILQMIGALSSPDGIPSDLRLAVSEWVRADSADDGWVVVPDLNSDIATEVFRARLQGAEGEGCTEWQITVESSDSSARGFSEVGVWQAKIDWETPALGPCSRPPIRSLSLGEPVSKNPGASHLWQGESEEDIKHDEDSIGRALTQWAMWQGRNSKAVKRMVAEQWRRLG